MGLGLGLGLGLGFKGMVASTATPIRVRGGMVKVRGRAMARPRRLGLWGGIVEV